MPNAATPAPTRRAADLAPGDLVIVADVTAEPGAVGTFFRSAAGEAAAQLAEVRRRADAGDEGAREAIYDRHLAGDHTTCRPGTCAVDDRSAFGSNGGRA